MQPHASPFLGHEEKTAWPMPSRRQVKGKDYWSLTAHQVSNMIQGFWQNFHS
jgi:hypothetical protein